MSDTPRTPAEVRAELSALARPVAEDLQRGLVQQQTRQFRGLAGPAIAFPAAYLFLTVMLAPLGISLQMPFYVVLLLSAILPCIRIFLRWQQAQQQRVADAAALRAIDRELQLSDRMATAHEFVEVAEPDGFQLAAIRDAQQRIEAARSARPSRPVVVPESPRMLTFGCLVAVLMLWLASMVNVVERGDVANPEGGREVAGVGDKPVEQPRDVENQPNPQPKVAEPRTPRKAQKDSDSSSAGEDETPSDASRRGKNPMGSGRSAEARAATGGGSERGQPSNQAQSTKSEKRAKPKPKKKKPKAKKDDEEKAEEQKKPPQESGSTLGRGSGKGSSKSPTASPWSAKDQVTSDEEEDPDEDEEVDDENDESKARGGVQPNLRQRKPPVNRDLQISMGSGKPQDDANGRGGPGGPKKQRGVAQLVLGVTFPDHVSAKPNPGMSKITQERIEPQAQQGDSIQGEGRGARAAPMGHLSRRVLSPWMQDLVRSFYLSLREEGGPQ